MPKTFSQSLFEHTGRTFSRILLTGVFPLEIRGAENIPTEPGLILAGNHSGLLDTPVIATACPHPLEFFMHEGVYRWPVIGRLMHLAPVIPYAPGREMAAIRQSLEALEAGRTLCIFPEGKLSKNGELAEFGPGVALLHRKSGRPVLPFYIEGGYEAWSWENRLSPRPGPLRISFGEPLRMADTGDTEGILEALRLRVESLKAGNVLTIRPPSSRCPGTAQHR